MSGLLARTMVGEGASKINGALPFSSIQSILSTQYFYFF